MTGHELIASRDSLDAPLLILTTMTLPLNDLRTIVWGCALTSKHLPLCCAMRRE